MNISLSHLPAIVDKKKKRIGRGIGSGRGSKSGRGTTRHQKARGSIPLHFEGGQGKMTKRFPLLRGKGKNKSVRPQTMIIGLDDLNDFKDGDIVSIDSLVKKNMFPKVVIAGNVKILANGKLTKKLIFKLPVSRTVKKIVESLGGKVEVA